jgi:hypothetical protein
LVQGAAQSIFEWGTTTAKENDHVRQRVIADPARLPEHLSRGRRSAVALTCL